MQQQTRSPKLEELTLNSKPKPRFNSENVHKNTNPKGFENPQRRDARAKFNPEAARKPLESFFAPYTTEERSNIIGELDHDFIERLLPIYHEAIDSSNQVTLVAEKECVKAKISALFYFSCAKKLLMSLPQSEKAKIKPIRDFELLDIYLPPAAAAVIDVLGKFSYDDWTFRLSAHSHEILWCFTKGLKILITETDSLTIMTGQPILDYFAQLDPESLIFSSCTSSQLISSKAIELVEHLLQQRIPSVLATEQSLQPPVQGPPNIVLTPLNLSRPYLKLGTNSSNKSTVDAYFRDYGELLTVKNDLDFISTLVLSCCESQWLRKPDTVLHTIFPSIPLIFREVTIAQVFNHAHLNLVPANLELTVNVATAEGIGEVTVSLIDLIDEAFMVLTGPFTSVLRKFFHIEQQQFNGFGSSAQLVQIPESNMKKRHCHFPVGSTYSSVEPATSLNLVKSPLSYESSLGHAFRPMKKVKYRENHVGRLQVRAVNVIGSFLGSDMGQTG